MPVGKPEATLLPHAPGAVYLYFETGSLIGLELTDLARLAIHGATGFLLSLSLSSTEISSAHHHPGIFTRVLGIELPLHACMASFLLTEPSPWPRKVIT